MSNYRKEYQELKKSFKASLKRDSGKWAIMVFTILFIYTGIVDIIIVTTVKDPHVSKLLRNNFLLLHIMLIFVIYALASGGIEDNAT